MSTAIPVLTLRRGKEESLLRFHPWVFSGAIATDTSGLEEGATVKIAAADGSLLGIGHYQIGSIAVRLLAMGREAASLAETGFDESFYINRLAEAFRLRQSLGLIRPDNNAYRLVHGEGDFLPGLIVDIYGDTAVVQAHSVGMHYARNIIADALTSLPELAIANVYYKSETTLPFKAQLDPVNDYILGSYSGNEALENGLRFHIDWLRGQKTGFFVDQRDNRSL